MKFLLLLITDYLCNVVDDLGLPATDTLTQTRQLLQTSADEFTDVAEDMPPRLTGAVATMRGISRV